MGGRLCQQWVHPERLIKAYLALETNLFNLGSHLCILSVFVLRAFRRVTIELLYSRIF